MTGTGQVTQPQPRLSVDPGAGRLRPVVHRVTTSTAAVVNEPSRDELAGLLDEVARSGRGSFLVAQRRTGEASEAYLQAVRHAGGWTLESRDDEPERDVRAVVVNAVVGDTALVEDVFVWWMQDLPAWRRLAWQPVIRDQHWLTHD